LCDWTSRRNKEDGKEAFSTTDSIYINGRTEVQ